VLVVPGTGTPEQLYRSRGVAPPAEDGLLVCDLYYVLLKGVLEYQARFPVHHTVARALCVEYVLDLVSTNRRHEQCVSQHLGSLGHRPWHVVHVLRPCKGLLFPQVVHNLSAILWALTCLPYWDFLWEHVSQYLRSFRSCGPPHRVHRPSEVLLAIRSLLVCGVQLRAIYTVYTYIEVPVGG